MGVAKKGAGATYADFAQIVRKAADKPRRKCPSSAANGNENLKNGRENYKIAHRAPRCNKPGNLKRTGKPCGAPAVRGGTRCYKHGGMRQVPEHPHNIARLERGEIDARLQHNRDRQQYWELPAPVKAAIDLVCKSAALPLNQFSRKLELARAYMLDDGGRAYRRIIKNIKVQ